MGKTAALSGLFFLTVVNCGFGALAMFNVNGPTSVPAGTSVEFSVTLSSVNDFDAAIILIATDGTGITFKHSEEWGAIFTLEPVEQPLGSGFLISSMAPVGSSVGRTSILLGTVTVSTAGLSEGTYGVMIDYSTDQTSVLSYQGVEDPISSQGGSFTVTPEPTSILSLLAMALLYVKRKT